MRKPEPVAKTLADFFAKYSRIQWARTGEKRRDFD
jgi:hypothetical protein